MCKQAEIAVPRRSARGFLVGPRAFLLVGLKEISIGFAGSSKECWRAAATLRRRGISGQRRRHGPQSLFQSLHGGWCRTHLDEPRNHGEYGFEVALQSSLNQELHSGVNRFNDVLVARFQLVFQALDDG